METIKEISAAQARCRRAGREGKSIGFVPTMGYLHEGHLSLVKAAKEETDYVVLSIFVNPLQFGEGEDFEAYPRDFERDERLAARAGVDLIFYPESSEMYRSGHCTYVVTEGLSGTLCGACRPGHFKGVTTVVAKLFGIVRPDKAYFGQKDAQQAVIIGRMVRDLNMGITVRTLPIIRERDGLAMSSRNAYLNADERKDATVLYRSLERASRLVASGERSAAVVIRTMKAMIEQKKSAKIEYVSIVDAEELHAVETIKGKILIALAVIIGKTRLIDNRIVNVE